MMLSNVAYTTNPPNAIETCANLVPYMGVTKTEIEQSDSGGACRQAVCQATEDYRGTIECMPS